MVRIVGSIALAAMVLLAAAAGAQQAPPQAQTQEQQPAAQFLEQVQVTVGNVDVTVVDAHGNLVTDLAKDDFVLFVDGKPTPISNFGAYARTVLTPAPGQEAAAATAEEAAVAPPRPGVVVILVDNSNTSVFDRNTVVARVEKWVRANLHPPDRAMVAVYQEGLRFVTPLTSSVEEISGALEDMLKSSSGIGANQMFRRMSETQIRDIAEQNRGSNSEIALDRAKVTARVNATQIRHTTEATANALKVLLRTLSGVPGRKSLVYVSDGLPRSPGLETFQLITELFPQARMGDTEFQSYETTSLWQELARWAAAADVTLYTIDARGLEVGGEKAAEHGDRPTNAGDIEMTYLYNYQDPLVAMANLTGGISIYNTNEFGKGLDRILAAMQTYYSLGFEMEPTAENVHHSVRVGVKGRDGLRLRYRTSIVERSLPTRVEDRTVAGLAFDVRENTIGVRLQLGRPVPAGKKRYTVPVKILVPVGNLALIPGDSAYTGKIMVFTAAAGDEGRRSPVNRAEHVIEIPAAKMDRVGTLAIDASVEVNEGHYRISVGVLDEQASEASYAAADASTFPAARL